jgi:hypothetical protein
LLFSLYWIDTLCLVNSKHLKNSNIIKDYIISNNNFYITEKAIEKFEKLAALDWHDLYIIELDTVNYNYNHYFSGRLLTKLKENETNI